MAMNLEIKARWVADLRSGRFQQGFGKLRGYDGDQELFCCLGVLCEIAVQDGIIERTTQGGSGIPGYTSNLTAFVDILSPEVSSWAGLHDTDPSVRMNDEFAGGDEEFMELSGVNDDLKLSFSKIADLIEEQL